jgi:hypothetical protein
VNLIFKTRAIALVLTAGLFLTACADHVGFVTTTSFGLGVDAATQKIHVGIGRDELFVGPAYPSTGGLPPVLGSLRTDGEFINSNTQTTFSTGDAAILIANEGNDATGILLKQMKSCVDLPDEARPICRKYNAALADAVQFLAEKDRCGFNAGCVADGRRLDVFGTQTQWGVILQLDQTGILSKFDLGYSRQEATLIPVNDDQASAGGNGNTDKKRDLFASELALFSAGDVVPPLGPPVQNSGGAAPARVPTLDYGVAQLIATGAAANGIAKDRDTRDAIVDQLRQAARAQQFSAKAQANAAQLKAAQFGDDANSDRIRKALMTDTTLRPKINTWLMEFAPKNTDIPELLNAADNSALRQKVINDLKIP